MINSIKVHFANEEKINLINLYKEILYPNINFKLNESHLSKTKKTNEISGVYFHTNRNYFIIDLLEVYYKNPQKIYELMGVNNIEINNYKCFFLIFNKHKEGIPIENIKINKIKNQWYDKAIKATNINNVHTLERVKPINNRSYKISLTKEEKNHLKKIITKNNNLPYLMFLLDNLENISNEILYIFDPFTGKKILFKDLKNMLTKQIIIYIYNLLYKTY